MTSLTESLSDTSWTQQPKAVVTAENDSGLRALVAAAGRLDLPVDAQQLWHQHGVAEGGFAEADIVLAAKRLGLSARAVDTNTKRLAATPGPALLRDRTTGDYALFNPAADGTAQITDADGTRPRSLSMGRVLDQFDQRVILIGKRDIAEAKPKPFGFSWFLPSILKHVVSFRRVIWASLIVQSFALISPKLFEVVIDRVLVSRGLQSLDVLALGLLAIALFEPIMTFIRNFIFAHVASCVNSELSVRLFRHLVHLPLSYFGERKTGEIIARVRELDHIRNFLTGSALMMVLDLAFVGVFLAVMYSYAPQLANITLISLFIFVAVWIAIAPLLKVRVEQEYERNAENTAFLTEAVTGIETIKSLGYNARFRRDWEERLASHLKASFRSAMIGNWAGGGIGLIQKIFSALILWFGVHLVLDGGLTVGQLVAFNMLSGHVTMPILRLAQIWQDFQHTGISIKRIGDILNEPTENAAATSKASMTKLQGEIELRKVTFRYTNDGREILRRLDLSIAPGQKLGITGLSGSGKSTITKLVQRLYVPQSGQVLVDGTDLAMVDPSTLRRQIGVVLQENYLFNGSITENILIANPTATQADVERVCKIAGADVFINDLQHGYDTPVGERGGNLSGGQRQRIAIARALISDPAILIFDEATSALDYESEAGIIERLPEILEGRTAVMIAHRLNSMQSCDRIIVMEKGEIIEDGTHDDLLKLDQGRYAQLWTLQTAGASQG